MRSMCLSLDCQTLEPCAHSVCKACFRPIGSALPSAASCKAFKLHRWTAAENQVCSDTRFEGSQALHMKKARMKRNCQQS